MHNKYGRLISILYGRLLDDYVQSISLYICYKEEKKGDFKLSGRNQYLVNPSSVHMTISA